MATFVLIHGAFVDGWSWSRVAPLLQAAGNRVYTPTLTGLGERAHLATPDLGLDIHVRDVLGVLDYDDLREVVLVGWSYGGMVAAGVADRAPHRIAHIVYLDASTPQDGQCQLDFMPPQSRPAFEEMAHSAVWLIPPPPESAFDPYVASGQLSGEEARAIAATCRPHPLKTFIDPLRLTNPAAVDLPRTYVFCAQNTGDEWRVAELRTRPDWNFRELDANHLAPFTHPRAVADVLRDVI